MHRVREEWTALSKHSNSEGMMEADLLGRTAESAKGKALAIEKHVFPVMFIFNMSSGKESSCCRLKQS